MEKFRANAKQSISLPVQYRKVERNDKVNRQPNLYYGKPAILRILKPLWKFIMIGLSVYGMDKVDKFRVTGNCISEKLSIIKAGSVYPFRKTILSMGSKIIPEEQYITELLDNQKYIAQTKHICPRIKTLKTDLASNDIKEGGFSDWDNTIQDQYLLNFQIFTTTATKQLLLVIIERKLFLLKDSPLFIFRNGKKGLHLKVILGIIT